METLTEELARLGATLIGSQHSPINYSQHRATRMYFTVVLTEIRNPDESESS